MTCKHISKKTKLFEYDTRAIFCRTRNSSFILVNGGALCFWFVNSGNFENANKQDKINNQNETSGIWEMIKFFFFC